MNNFTHINVKSKIKLNLLKIYPSAHFPFRLKQNFVDNIYDSKGSLLFLSHYLSLIFLPQKNRFALGQTRSFSFSCSNCTFTLKKSLFFSTLVITPAINFPYYLTSTIKPGKGRKDLILLPENCIAKLAGLSVIFLEFISFYFELEYSSGGFTNSIFTFPPSKPMAPACKAEAHIDDII